jgi:hypothetical protein
MDPRHTGSARPYRNTASVLLCDVIEHVQAARSQRKHCSNIVGRVCVCVCVSCGRCLAMDLQVTVVFSAYMSTLSCLQRCYINNTKSDEEVRFLPHV